MKTTVKISSPLRSLTDGATELSCSATTVSGLIEELESRYPGLKERLLDPTGNPHRFIAIYLNEDDIRSLDGLRTPLGSGDTVSILQAVAGG